MSLVHKIPPLVSALAFGYGVGMAAPESAVKPVRVAARIVEIGSRGEGEVGPRRTTIAALQPAAHLPIVDSRGGDESRELMKLRDAAMHDDKRAMSPAERPLMTRAPRYESAMGRETEGAEVDDLDAAGSEALSKLQLPDLRVSVTRRTLKYVKFFTRTDRGRGLFETWLKRSGRYQELVTTELRDRRLPEDLIWVAMIESGFDPRARSPAGAVGLWQFMPTTGEVYGLAQNRFLDQRKNPRLATQAAAHHLRDLYMRFGSWDLALAAYNMGYEQLIDAIDKYGTADFNELARQQAIPEETANYVPKIAAAAIVANNLERFGFERIEAARPVDAAEIAVPPGTPLKILAKASGVSTSTVRGLNPDILGERVPPGRGDYLVMIPSDTLSRAHAALPSMLQNEPIVTDEASVLDPVNLLPGSDLARRHAEREDDSLLSLLPHYRKHGHSFRDGGSFEERIHEELGDAGERDKDDDDAPRPAHHPRSNRETVVYKVGPGDTLIGIARQFAMDVEDVSKQNHIDSDEKLRVGSLLKLKVRKDVLPVESDKAEKKEPTHRHHRHPKDG
jgi:membrane-bound lytic murein transglycosylase D